MRRRGKPLSRVPDAGDVKGRLRKLTRRGARVNIVSHNPTGSGPVRLAARLPRFVGAKGDVAAKLRAVRIGVAGCGSVGLNAAAHAARLQPAKIIVADPKAFKAESMLTHPILAGAIGTPKAQYAADVCRQISPTTKIEAFVGRFEDLPLDVVADLDVCVMAPDNLRAEVAIGQACMNLGVPLLQASVSGEMLVAQVRFWWFGRGGGDLVCPACKFSKEEFSQMSQEVRFRCGGPAPVGAEAQERAIPTMSVSFLCAMAAELAMFQLLRFVAGLGTPVCNTELEYCAYTHRTVVTPLRRRRDCPCDHT
ncbi:MAG: ThiF family adenylyltransferase, partial [Verrucomicrobiae bacterium]|nr:ThiF family adenylyltransferase [Verrucomicrobiae bacterium]